MTTDHAHPGDQDDEAHEHASRTKASASTAAGNPRPRHRHDHHHHAHGGPVRSGHSGRAHAGDYRTAFFLGTLLNLAIVAVEVAYGVASHSMSLIADAGHNLSDVLGLALGWAASVLATRRPSARRTYGMRRVSILAALANSILLLVATGGVAWQSIERLSSPEVVHGRTVMWVAAIAVVVNTVSALLFLSGRRADMNVRSAFSHLAADAGLALGVVATGAVIEMTNWYLLDPVVSLVLAVLIVASTWSLLRGSIDLVLDAVPEGIDPVEVRTYLAGLPGVREVHDLHIWAMSTTETALTAHLVAASPAGPGFLGDVCRELHDRFDIEHATLQLESEDAPDPCRLAPEETV